MAVTDKITGALLRLVQLDRWSLPFLPLAPGLEDGSGTPENASTGMETGRGLPAKPVQTLGLKTCYRVKPLLYLHSKWVVSLA